MALGNTNNTQSDHELVILKIKNKIIDKETGKEVPAIPHVFEVSKKVNGKWTKQDKYETQVSGRLAKIDFDTGEWEGNEYNIIKLILEDEEVKQNFLLDLRATSDFRNLANSLLNLEDFSDVRISLYKTHSDKHNKDFSNIAVWSNDKHIKGKFEWKDLPAVEEIKDKRGTVIKRDTQEVDTFFIEKLKELSKTIGGKPPVKKSVTKAPAKSKVTEVEGGVNGDAPVNEDLPF